MAKFIGVISAVLKISGQTQTPKQMQSLCHWNNLNIPKALNPYCQCSNGDNSFGIDFLRHFCGGVKPDNVSGRQAEISGLFWQPVWAKLPFWVA
ncbi:MAG: hypothetical protein K8S55_04395 [Phycisphaerae bacterium]|nr:hypothetical protein [Phycisphaerae bacterium]